MTLCIGELQEMVAFMVVFWIGNSAGMQVPTKFIIRKTPNDDTDGRGEIFADMFVGWVYRCWEPDPLRPNGLSETGELRSSFMNENMPKWIYQKINGR
jgi:hypothetical protein